MVAERSLLDGARRNLAALGKLHDELAGDRGGVVVVGGPRGVGKALLLTELRRELSAQGRLALFGRAELSSTKPYAALRDPAAQAMSFLEQRGRAEQFLDDHGRALSVLLPTLSGPTSRARDKSGFLEDLRAFFLDLARVAPVTLVLTDVHYADGDTRDAVRFLARHLFAPDGGGDEDERFHGVLMLAARTDDPDSAAFVASLSDGPRVRPFHVDGFSRDELVDFLAHHPFIDRLLSASRGRPEDVGELLEALPRDVDTLLRGRIAALDATARRAVEALAVLGRPAPADLLAAIVGVAVADVASRLGPLVEARLLTRRLQTGELLFTFARPHHQEVIARSLPVDDARALHHAIAVAIEAREGRDGRGGDAHEQLLAQHFLHGIDAARGIPYALAACDKLQLTFAYGTVVELVRLALPVADDRARFALLGHLVEARRLRGELPAALDAAEQMRSLAHTTQLPAVLRRIGELRSARGEHREALEILEEACALLDARMRDTTRSDAAAVDLDDDTDQDALPERAQVFAAMADAAYAKGELQRAGDDVERALHAAPAAPLAFRLRAFNTLGKIAFSRERYDDAEARFVDNLRLAEDAGLEHEAVLARINVGLARHRRGHNDAAREVLERALASARAVGDLHSEAHALLNLGAIAQRLGEIGRALESYRAALQRFTRLGNRAEVRRTTWNLANLTVAIGAYDAARTWLDQSRRIAETEESPRGLAFAFATEGDLSFNRREPAAALGSYARARALFSQLHEQSRVDEMTTRAAWSAVLVGDLHAARALLDEQRPALAGSVAAARRMAVEGAIDSYGSSTTRGLALWNSGIDELTRLGVHDDAWRALAFLADRTDELGDARSAESARARARAIVEAAAAALPDDLRAGMMRDPLRARLFGLPTTPPTSAHDTTTMLPTTQLPTTQLPTTQLPTTQLPTTQLPTTQLPTTQLPGPADAITPPVVVRKPEWDARYRELIGLSPAIHRVLDRLDRLSRTRQATVLVRGESGTGKELVAAAVHRLSHRSSGPFVRVNCAALVETLLMSELFGHEKGSFTGALSRKIGRFELARGGTIFLDEIGDISPKTQVSLLRVLQERQFERVGGTQTVTTDAAVICATHRDLEEMVRQGSFREDLYYRLKGVVVEVPALRERPEDIPLLVAHFLERAREELGRAPRALSDAAVDVLQRHRWPGNIRELQNVVRSVALFCEDDVVRPEHLAEFPELFASHVRVGAAGGASFTNVAPAGATGAGGPPPSSAAGNAPPASFARAPSDGARIASPARASWDAASPGGELVRPPNESSSSSTSSSSLSSGPATPSSEPASAPGAAGTRELLRRVEEQASGEGLALGDLKRRLEFEAVANAIRQTDGNITRAAALLKMKRPRLSQIVNGNPDLKALKESMRNSDD